MSDTDEMRTAMWNAGWCKISHMNYKDMYDTTYAALAHDGYAHEDLHRASIRITDAILGLMAAGKNKEQSAAEAVDAVLNTLS
jgi:hypothetical protein